ncbi:helix-turn-helix domain-containing protein, partial [Blautia sp. MSK22_86]|nr:helix-turn-helix domain-containing protein [Blautia sp. MSK22_86]
MSHTASALFIHRSNLLYRLDKIKAYLDSDLTDRNENLYLLLSFHRMDI